MQQAINELSERCQILRQDNKKLDAENNFFHMSTTIFIKLKQVMEAEKQLCYQLADLNSQNGDPDYEYRREGLETGIQKCRNTIVVMESKLKKALDHIKNLEEDQPSPKIQPSFKKANKKNEFKMSRSKNRRLELSDIINHEESMFSKTSEKSQQSYKAI